MGTMTRERRLKQEAERAEQAAQKARWAEEEERKQEQEQEQEIAAWRAEWTARTGEPPSEQDLRSELGRRLPSRIVKALQRAPL